MLELLDNPKYDNERNVLNADLFFNNLKNTLKAFGFNPRVSYRVYRFVTIYDISWSDDKDYSDFLSLDKEIALALGISKEKLHIYNMDNNKAMIKAYNMKRDIVCLKEVFSDFKRGNGFDIAIGFDEEDNVFSFELSSLLVMGSSGSGKTNLFRCIMMNMLCFYRDTLVIILDSQGINYNDFSSRYRVINDDNDIIREIKSLRSLFEDRVKSGNRDRIVVFIDEIYDLVNIDNSILMDIEYLVTLGSEYGIFIVLSTDSMFNDDVKRLFDKSSGSKISFYLSSKNEYNDFIATSGNDIVYNYAIYRDNSISEMVIIPLVSDDEIRRVINS